MNTPVTNTRLRRCRLQHLETGRIIDCNSIVKFCRKAKLDETARYHISPILNGTRREYKGWFNPDYLNQKVALTDIYGNQYQPIAVAELMERGLSSPTISRLIRGKPIASRRLAPADKPFNGALQPRGWKVAQYVFQLTTPNRPGRPALVQGSNLTQIAADLGYTHPSNLYPLLYGLRKSIKVGPDHRLFLLSVRTEPKVSMPGLELVTSETAA